MRGYGVVDFICCDSRKVPPHQSPLVTASPRGGSLCKLLLSAAQFGGNGGQSGLLFTAQFAAPGLLSAAQFGGCYPRHSLVLRRGVVIPDTVQNRCYSRHISPFCAENRVVIGGTFAFGVVILGTIRRGCYPQHNCRCLPRYALLNITLYRLFFCAWLLNTAQFRVLLSAAHFPCFAVVIRSTFRFGVVIGGTIPKTLLFTAQFGKKPGCYSQHISFWGC